MDITDEALRRGELFDAMQDRLTGRENRAMGAIKETIFEGPDLPDERDAALDYLEEVKAEKLSDGLEAVGEEKAYPAPSQSRLVLSLSPCRGEDFDTWYVSFICHLLPDATPKQKRPAPKSERAVISVTGGRCISECSRGTVCG